jgi:hypothetical protein
MHMHTQSDDASPQRRQHCQTVVMYVCERGGEEIMRGRRVEDKEEKEDV